MPSPHQTFNDRNLVVAQLSEPVPRHMGVRFVSIIVALAATKKMRAAIELNVESKPDSDEFTVVALKEIPAGTSGTHRSTLQWPVPGGCRFRVDISGGTGVAEVIENYHFIDM